MKKNCKKRRWTYLSANHHGPSGPIHVLADRVSILFLHSSSIPVFFNVSRAESRHVVATDIIGRKETINYLFLVEIPKIQLMVTITRDH